MVSPALLLSGSIVVILTTTAAAVAGIWSVSVGLAGHLFANLGTAARAGFVAAGIALLLPPSLVDGAMFINIAGAVLAAVLTVIGRRQRALQNPA